MSRFSQRINDDIELRELTPEDAPAYFELVEKNRAMLNEWQPGQAFLSIEGVRSFLQSVQVGGKNLHLNIGIWHEGALTGFLQLYAVHTADEGGIGYWLDEAYQGRGWMTTAVHAFISTAFEQMGYTRMVIDCPENNTRSRAVPVRLGFCLKEMISPEKWGRRPDGPRQCIFTMEKDDWQTNPDQLAGRIRETGEG